MGLYPQPNDWTCGPFALKHALATLGRIASEETIKVRANTRWWAGTDEINLTKAAAFFDCELQTVRSRRAEIARKRLTHFLKKRIPVIVCVDEWEHWIVVVRSENGGRFVIIDSDLDPVVMVLSWKQLERRWRYRDVDYDEEEPPLLYDMHPVVPRFRVAVSAGISVAKARHLRQAKHARLAHHWNTYLEDLLEVCRPPNVRMIKPLSMAEFLRRNSELVVSRVLYWYGDIERKCVEELLADYRFVAETYGLVIPEAKARRAVADLAILATLWATANRGSAAMYGVP
jgi:hypothetical protein